MRFLRKISPSPYADSIHGVIAYSGEEEDYRDDLDRWAQGDAETQARRDEVIAGFQEAVAEREFAQLIEPYLDDSSQEAHEDAVNTIGSNMAGAAVVTGIAGGGPAVAAGVAVVTGIVTAYQTCEVACHDQSPPRPPGG